MSSDILRSYVRTVLSEAAQQGTAVLSSPSSGDISQAIMWLKLNGVLRNASNGTEKQPDGTYRLLVRFYGPRDRFVELVKNRYGSFIDVE